MIDRTEINKRWLEDTDYRRGYNAYCAGLTDDISESPAWHEGYAQAQTDDSNINDSRGY